MFCRVRRFSDEQCGIRDATRDFVRKEIAPFAAEWDRTATVPLETVRRAGRLSTEQQALLRDFLERCDLAKFAPVGASADEIMSPA